MANPRSNSGWEDKKRPLFRNDTSIKKKPRLDIKVVSSCKSSVSPLKNVSPSKSFKRTSSLPSSSRDSPSPTDEILLSAVRATEEEEAKIARELQAMVVANNESKNSSKANIPSTSKAVSNLITGNSKSSEAQQAGNNGSSGFDKLFCDEINEDFVEECMNLATALSQQPPESSPPASSSRTPAMSQAYEFFFQGVKAHSSVLEKTISRPPVKKPATFRVPASTTTSNRMTLNQNNQPFRKPPPPSTAKPQNTSTIDKTKEQRSKIYPPGAEAEIRRLELEVERLAAEKKQIKEAQNTKDGEAAVLRFQVNEGQNQMKQLKATQAQALAAMNAQYQEKLKELQKANESLKSQLQVQVMENNSVRERSKLLELSNSRIRLVEPQNPHVTSPLNSSAVKNQRNRPSSSFLNRSTFQEDMRSPPKPSSKPSPSTVQQEPIFPMDGKMDGQCDLWYHLSVPERNVGCSLALRLAGWERIEADDSDDSCSARRIEYDQDSSLDLLKIAPVGIKKRIRVFNEKDVPGLAACVDPLRTIFLWPEFNLESPAAQELLRKIAIECCGIVHYKYVLLKDHETDLDEKVVYERDCDIIERGGDILSLTADVDLLDDRPWYKGERGISSRRAFGLLSELAFVSTFVSALLTGNLTSRQSPLERHRFTELPDFADACSINRPSQESQPAKNDKEPLGDKRMETGEVNEANASPGSSWILPDRYWFLEVSADLCLTIVRQKRTNQFNGVFVGLLTLLRKCAQNGGIVGEARTIVLRIIRGILLARPSIYTLRCVLHLLEQLSDCEDLMTGLCTYNDHDNYQEDVVHGLYFFRSDSCLLELLCAQLNSAGKNRCHLADPMVRWLLAVFAHTTVPPRWLVPHITSMRTDDKDSVAYAHSVCCPRVISTAVTLINEAFQTLKDLCEREDWTYPCEESERRGLVPKVMQRAIILLHTLAVNDLSEYMGRVEGDYDVLIPGLNRIRQHLNLGPGHDKLLCDLVRLEETDDAQGTVDPVADDVISEDVWSDSVQNILLP